MKITGELLGELAALSRLELPEGEKALMTEELERIVAYMDILDTLDTDGAEPMSHVLPLKNVLRADEAAPSLDRAALLANAPDTDGEAFLVSRAVE